MKDILILDLLLSITVRNIVQLLFIAKIHRTIRASG